MKKKGSLLLDPPINSLLILKRRKVICLVVRFLMSNYGLKILIRRFMKSARTTKRIQNSIGTEDNTYMIFHLYLLIYLLTFNEPFNCTCVVKVKVTCRILLNMLEQFNYFFFLLQNVTCKKHFVYLLQTI